MRSNTRRGFLKKSVLGGLAISTAGMAVCSGQNPAKPQNAQPETVRPRQGKSVMGLRCDPIPAVRIGVVGLGRGGDAVNRLARIEGANIVAISDLLPDRIERSQRFLRNAGCPEAVVYSGEEDWKKMCERDDIDLIYNATPWDLHVPITLSAMEHGKHAAVEVPVAHTVNGRSLIW